jgi:hypothetical protein
MILHLISQSVRQPPYITIITKKQLWFGNGRLKDSEYPKGLRGSMGIRIPTDVEIEKKNQFYGYHALIKPWAHLNNITNTAVRQKILWEVIDGKSLSDVRPILGKGYIREDGTLDPKQTQGISCYVFMLADPSIRKDQNDWIKQQPFYVRAQILRNMSTHTELLKEKQKAASTLVTNNNKLLALKEYLQLEPQVDRELITWDDDD